MKEGEPIKKEYNKEINNDKKLLKEYSYLVEIIAYRMLKNLPPNIESSDLINAGAYGLYEAIRKYDSSKKTLLKTYAEFRIKGAMLDFLRSQDPIPRSRHKKEKLGEIEPLEFVNVESLKNESPHSGEERNDPFINASARERAEKISSAIKELPSRERTIIKLYHYEGLTLKDIGSRLGITEGYASQIHSEVIKKLKKKLKELKE